MIVEEIKSSKECKVSNLISEKFSQLSYGEVQKLLRNKDVKINGKRIAKDCLIGVDDVVQIYLKEEQISHQFKIIFEDENLVVVFKPRKIETVSDDDVCLNVLLEKQLNQKLFAVHRLDRNTEGLVVFAKNLESKSELDFAFKHRTIDKFYLAYVYGSLKKKSDELVAYLKKDAEKSVVHILDNPERGYEEIQTNYKVLKELDNSSLLEVELVTGKTHQIRAHLAHINHFVIGDEKYGDSKINKLFKKKFQCLCAYKIIFHFEKGVLKYLDGKEISLAFDEIDFCKNM